MIYIHPDKRKRDSRKSPKKWAACVNGGRESRVHVMKNIGIQRIDNAQRPNLCKKGRPIEVQKLAEAEAMLYFASILASISWF